jgi:hypothetical protein
MSFDREKLRDAVLEILVAGGTVDDIIDTVLGVQVDKRTIRVMPVRERR